MTNRGIGLIEILLVLAVVAVGSFLLFRYLGMTARTVEQIQQERPAENARLAADRATLVTLQGLLQAYQAQNGQWPADKAAALALLGTSARLQCPGNDFDYEPTTGTVRLVIDAPNRC